MSNFSVETRRLLRGGQVEVMSSHTRHVRESRSKQGTAGEWQLQQKHENKQTRKEGGIKQRARAARHLQPMGPGQLRKLEHDVFLGADVLLRLLLRLLAAAGMTR